MNEPVYAFDTDGFNRNSKAIRLSEQNARGVPALRDGPDAFDRKCHVRITSTRNATTGLYDGIFVYRLPRVFNTVIKWVDGTGCKVEMLNSERVINGRRYEGVIVGQLMPPDGVTPDPLLGEGVPLVVVGAAAVQAGDVPPSGDCGQLAWPLKGDALVALVTESTGRCSSVVLGSSAVMYGQTNGLDWTSLTTIDTGTGSWKVTYTRPNCGLPKLVFSKGTGTAAVSVCLAFAGCYKATAEEGGYYYAIFSGGGTVLCGGTSGGACADGLFRVKVYCAGSGGFDFPYCAVPSFTVPGQLCMLIDPTGWCGAPISPFGVALSYAGEYDSFVPPTGQAVHTFIGEVDIPMCYTTAAVMVRIWSFGGGGGIARQVQLTWRNYTFPFPDPRGGPADAVQVYNYNSPCSPVPVPVPFSGSWTSDPAGIWPPVFNFTISELGSEGHCGPGGSGVSGGNCGTELAASTTLSAELDTGVTPVYSGSFTGTLGTGFTSSGLGTSFTMFFAGGVWKVSGFDGGDVTASASGCNRFFATFSGTISSIPYTLYVWR